MLFSSLARPATLAGMLLIGLLSFTSQAAEPTVAILYPDLREPYREVITDIIDGIKQESPEGVELFAIGEGTDRGALKESITTSKAGVVIALGRGGFTAAKELDLNIPIVIGALLISPEESATDLSGISLAADPEKLFAELKLLSPSVKTVNVVYKPANSAWLVELGQDAAKRYGLHLATYPVQDIKSAAKVYKDIFNKSRQHVDSIWLLPDPAVVDEASVLPLILKGSWDSSVPVFSTNPVHAKRGALFAMYPDNKAMGISLAKIARQRLKDTKKGERTAIVPLSDLQSAVNTRTADHLGITISIEHQRSFTLMFPAAQ